MLLAYSLNSQKHFYISSSAQFALYEDLVNLWTSRLDYFCWRMDFWTLSPSGQFRLPPQLSWWCGQFHPDQSLFPRYTSWLGLRTLSSEIKNILMSVNQKFPLPYLPLPLWSSGLENQTLTFGTWEWTWTHLVHCGKVSWRTSCEDWSGFGRSFQTDHCY